MSLRAYKANLKRFIAVEKEASQLVDSAQQDDRLLGVPGVSVLHDYAMGALAEARALRTRTLRARAKLYPNVRAALNA